MTLANKLSITFPLLRDEDLKVALSYGVAMKGDEIAVPSVFVINRQKRITYQHVGESVMDRPSASTLLDKAKEAKGG